ncbi:MAG: hypothetical protein ACRDT1_12265 [Micromonosporaceae bacterium]
MRVLVTGNAGAGKSTLAQALASDLRAPYFGLDQIVWRERWQKAPEHERHAAISDLVALPAWVIDGVSEQVQAAADVVVFLDVPRRTCYWRVLGRNLPYLFRSRPGLPRHCPEILIAPRLCRIIWRFPRHVRAKILETRGPLLHVRAGGCGVRRTARVVAETTRELHQGSSQGNCRR